MDTYKTDLLDLRCMDCMELMRETPDNYYSLAITDPPYGIGYNGKMALGQSKFGWIQWEKKDWDSAIPDQAYFKDLKRVSKNQIVWGGNYFTAHLESSMGWIVWDKGQRGFSLADGELAWTSFNKAMRILTLHRATANREQKQHPTQKPVRLYDWLLSNYAKPGDTILDTHLGSASIAIACHYARHHLTGCELDPDYFAASIERVKRETAQTHFL